jgi:hypothetical protein
MSKENLEKGKIMGIQDLDYAWFVENLKSLYKQHPNKHLVISNKTIFGAYDSFDAAFHAAIENFEPGKFIIQECEPEPRVLFSYNNRAVFA